MPIRSIACRVPTTTSRLFRATIIGWVATIVACSDSPSSSPVEEPARASAFTATTPTSFTMVVADSVEIALRVTDQRSNGVPAVSVSFTVTEGAGTVQPPVAVSDANGQVKIRWIMGTAAASNGLRATALQLPPVDFVSVARAGPAAELKLETQPGNAQIGSLLATQPVVRLFDRYGNRTASATDVTASIGSGGGNVSGTTTVAAPDGTARFTNLEITGPVGPRTIRFSAPGLVSASSNSFTLMPATRSFADRPDDNSGAQIHFLYVVPSRRRRSFARHGPRPPVQRDVLPALAQPANGQGVADRHFPRGGRRDFCATRQDRPGDRIARCIREGRNRAAAAGNGTAESRKDVRSLLRWDEHLRLWRSCLAAPASRSGRRDVPARPSAELQSLLARNVRYVTCGLSEILGVRDAARHPPWTRHRVDRGTASYDSVSSACPRAT